MEELDIGDVKFHISRPPRVDFPTYRRLQRLMLSPALGTRRGFFRGFTPAFLIAALVSFVASAWCNALTTPSLSSTTAHS